MDAMAKLGRKFTCYSCHTKFYDLGKNDPRCPKCGSDQRDADDMPVVTSHRRAKAAPAPVVVVPIEEEFVEDAVEPSDVVEPEEEGEIIGEIEPQEPEDEDDDDEEEEY